jgi:aspartyl protease family protein
MRQQYAGHAQEVRIRKAADGHFYAQATIEGAQTMALIDTGATGVVIGNRWLQAIGWDPSSGNYSMPVRTGNGTIYVHRLELPEITVAGLTIRDVDAIIHPPGSSTPDIIGMSFFNKLRSVQMANGELILRG